MFLYLSFHKICFNSTDRYNQYTAKSSLSAIRPKHTPIIATAISAIKAVKQNPKP